MKIPHPPNRLLQERSPYLRQHARNPVDWYPWGDEAFERARREDKPVFLSIGYSTCHWCHVMAHESFEDEGVAALLKMAFISVKVDREERPDIDKIYMAVCQMLTGSGGWPLTIVMTPDRQPFFAATYIPRESRAGRMGMLDLLPRIADFWIKRRQDVLNSAGQIIAALQAADEKDSSQEALSPECLDQAFRELQNRFDDEHGGFAPAPKFPLPHQILFLLHYFKSKGETEALRMAGKTLQAMQLGGIYDHVGFGFHRYSTDEQWLVPHFEKMLYDQALLAMAYTEAYQATRRKSCATTAKDILAYVLRDMVAPDGGFYAAEDADSEGEEGRFYLWSHDDILQTLGAEESDFFIPLFGVERGGNYIDEASRHRTGRNILHLREPLKESANARKMTEKAFMKRFTAARRALFSVRQQRVHPHKDDKVLTDWNGLMIAAFAKAAAVFADNAYAHAARSAADFILHNLRGQDGRLWHCQRGSQAGITANLDDYAFLIWGFIECYEAFLDPSYLREALSLQKDVEDHFWDGDKGGFFFTPDDGEPMIARQKEAYDGAIPSGNAVAAYNMIRLSRLTGRAELETKALRTLQCFAGALSRMPSAYTYFMSALDILQNPSYDIVIVGRPDAQDTGEMIACLRRPYLPNTLVLFRPSDDPSSDIPDIAPFTQDMRAIDGKATAYVCRRSSCLQPITDVQELADWLSKK